MQELQRSERHRDQRDVCGLQERRRVHLHECGPEHDEEAAPGGRWSRPVCHPAGHGPDEAGRHGLRWRGDILRNLLRRHARNGAVGPGQSVCPKEENALEKFLKTINIL